MSVPCTKSSMWYNGGSILEPSNNSLFQLQIYCQIIVLNVSRLKIDWKKNDQRIDEMVFFWHCKFIVVSYKSAFFSKSKYNISIFYIVIIFAVIYVWLMFIEVN